MNVIRVLPQQEAQKIAAGEVVERPANIIKELVENSIDAGATAIELHIEKAGKQHIKVVDNGTGMDREDALLCFTRHATSKISSVDELLSVQSYGFRGEALASISSVAHITLLTNTHDAQEKAIQVTVNGETTPKAEASIRDRGTSITVDDLFYNVPARKKFLKQNETEANHIMQNMYAFCMQHIGITFTVYKDGKKFLFAPKTDSLENRIAQLWGHDVGDNMISIPEETDNRNGISVWGTTSHHMFWRYGKQQMFIFVNNRLVKNFELYKAVLKGYRNVLPTGKFPACCLFITIDGSSVDVNIHPRKEEVRFSKPGSVTNLLEQAVHKQLTNYLSEPLHQQEASSVSSLTSAQINSQKLAPFSSRPTPTEKATILETGLTSAVQNNDFKTPPMTGEVNMQNFADPFETKPITPVKQAPTQAIAQSVTQPTSNPVVEQQPIVQQKVDTQAPQFKVLGQVLDTFIIIHTNETMYIVDQHAAHERILYERFAQKFEQKDGVQLLFPEVIKLTKPALESIIKHVDFFAQHGIGINQVGESEIAITSSPPKLQRESLTDFVQQMAEWIQEHETTDGNEFEKNLTEHVHSHLACKMAIRSGDILSQEEMEELIKQLLKTKDMFICAHGRPSMWRLDKKELEKKFHRCG